MAVRCLRELLRFHRPKFIFLFETKVAHHDQAARIGKCVDYSNVFCILVNGSSRGSILLWKDEFVLNKVLGNPSMIHCAIEKDGSANDQWWYITFVYRPLMPSGRIKFWDELNRIGETKHCAWAMACDFNAVLEQRDKKGGKPVASSSTSGFWDMVDKNNLIDLGFTGYAFTWNNRRVEKANVQECLDRSFANEKWRNAVVSHFMAFHSDHRHILINSSPPTGNRPKPFRFEAMWTRDAT